VDAVLTIGYIYDHLDMSFLILFVRFWHHADPKVAELGRRGVWCWRGDREAVGYDQNDAGRWSFCLIFCWKMQIYSFLQPKHTGHLCIWEIFDVKWSKIKIVNQSWS